MSYCSRCLQDVQAGVTKLLNYVSSVKRLADIRDDVWNILSEVWHICSVIQSCLSKCEKYPPVTWSMNYKWRTTLAIVNSKFMIKPLWVEFPIWTENFYVNKKMKNLHITTNICHMCFNILFCGWIQEHT